MVVEGAVVVMVCLVPDSLEEVVVVDFLLEHLSVRLPASTAD